MFVTMVHMKPWPHTFCYFCCFFLYLKLNFTMSMNDSTLCLYSCFFFFFTQNIIICFPSAQEAFLPSIVSCHLFITFLTMSLMYTLLYTVSVLVRFDCTFMLLFHLLCFFLLCFLFPIQTLNSKLSYTVLTDALDKPMGLDYGTS